jgi:glutamate-ammonia-ligase adenylyltransferase
VLVVSRSAFADYHRGSTQVWERQAFIKARMAAGDPSLGRDVVEELSMIVYSKPLTPGDLAEMLRIRGRMEVEIAKEDPDRYNIKTGRGSIVDIEFLTQALQLSAGVDRRFRTQYTPKALKRLCSGGLISAEDYGFLKEAYSFYRLIEQRLRVVHDRPEGNIYRRSDELSTLAALSGYNTEGGAEKLWAECTGYREKTRELYIKILEALKKNM